MISKHFWALRGVGVGVKKPIEIFYKINKSPKNTP